MLAATRLAPQPAPAASRDGNGQLGQPNRQPDRAEGAVLAFPPRPLRWLFLDLNSYFASVEQQLNPALRGRPIAVAPVDSDTTVAIAASVEAKRYGIGTGTPIWEAKRKCRDLIIVPGNHARYVEYHERVIAEVWNHVPVTHVCSIDEVACRLLDNENSPEAALALAHRIKAGIRANVGECLTSSVGIAPNRLLAKLASDMRKPDGLVMFTEDQLPHRLFDMPLRDIAGIGAKMERRLARDGILDIRQYCERRPRDAGSAWGGVNGDRLWYLLHGKFEDDKSNWRASIRLPCTQDSFVILHALDALFPRLAEAGRARTGGFRLRMVGVTLCEIEGVEGEQGSLFAALDPDDPLARETRTLALSRAMDRINERFGRNAVSVGPLNGGRIDAVGTKIAFGRIPEASEFHE